MSLAMPNGGTYSGYNFDESPHPDDVEEDETIMAGPPPPPPGTGPYHYAGDFLSQQVAKLSDQLTTMGNTIATIATHSAVTTKDLEQHEHRIDTFDRIFTDLTKQVTQVTEDKHEEHARLREHIQDVRAQLNQQLADLRFTMTGQISDTVKEALRNELQQQRNVAQDQTAASRANFQNAFTVIMTLVSIITTISTIILSVLLAAHK